MTDCPPPTVEIPADTEYRKAYVDLGRKICDKYGKCLVVIRQVNRGSKFPEFEIVCKVKE